MCYLLLLLISYFNWFVIADDDKILPSLDAHAAEVDLIASHDEIDNGGLAALKLYVVVVSVGIVLSVDDNLDGLQVGHGEQYALKTLGKSTF